MPFHGRARRLRRVSDSTDTRPTTHRYGLPRSRRVRPLQHRTTGANPIGHLHEATSHCRELLRPYVATTSAWVKVARRIDPVPVFWRRRACTLPGSGTHEPSRSGATAACSTTTYVDWDAFFLRFCHAFQLAAGSLPPGSSSPRASQPAYTKNYARHCHGCLTVYGL
jgi:hypothetical protein